MSHPPPLIALCARVLTFSDEGKRDAYSSSQPYSRAVARAGGVPVMVPPIHELAANALTVLQHFDGVLLPGGGDVDPRRYGQEATDENLYGITEIHDELDIAVCLAAIELDLPMLALCR
ncbi:MAG: gamma-glutamyl-gamma-aminobutyrate hydrolase family protein, partial [Ilumatobacteraceae bacterium]|nr:gamma-glutamyl-gamma-aminobutyrate hydrolase family protein [Ilumatobacteraceae bacterium]